MAAMAPGQTESETSDDDNFLNEIMGKPKKAYMLRKAPLDLRLRG